MEIEELENQALGDIQGAKTETALEDIRVKYLGRKGVLTAILRGLKDLDIESRRKVGEAANALRTLLESVLQERRGALLASDGGIGERFDLTAPGMRIAVGHLHPLTLIADEIKNIFKELNFSIVEGPEIENEYYNFDALNIPAGHPARDMWDTFWLKQSANSKEQREKLLLRTHTSPMQIRYMEQHEPPFRIIVPGRVFRYEAIDASHQINFHQVEGLVVDERVSLANFKYVITAFLQKLFGKNVRLRMRPSYFPFVEPGLEIDIQLPKSDKWLEVMGAGMVHPKVFDAVKYNPKFVKGFAFGLGLERMAMIKYHIPDIRLFYENDMRFLKQF